MESTTLPAAELARVVSAVRHHPELGPQLNRRAGILKVESHGAGEAMVAIYDHDKDRTLVATVQPSKRRVVSVDESPAQFQLSDTERQDAEAIARRDARVKRFLARRPMNPLTRLYFPRRASPHRHAIVFLRPSSSERAYAVVDLTDRRVVDVLSHSDFAG